MRTKTLSLRMPGHVALRVLGGRVSLLALLLLAGCGKETAVVPGLAPPAKMEGHKLVMLTEDWAMPEQTPLSIGFWGSSADVKVAVDPWKLNKGNPPHTISVNAVLRDREFAPRSKEIDRKLADPKLRGFVRVIPRALHEVKSGQVGGLKFASLGRITGVIYCLEPRTPEVPLGWTLSQSSRRLVELPLEGTDRAWWGDSAQALFKKGASPWDLKAIDINPDRRFYVSVDEAYLSPLSKWSEKRPRRDQMGRFEMEPLVFAEVMSYTIKETATGASRTGEILTGRIEGAGKFIRVISEP